MSVKTIWLVLLLIIFSSCKKEEELPLPKADFFIEIKNCENDTCKVYFYDNSLNAYSRTWDFGNGTLSNNQIDSSLFYQYLSYTVILKAKNMDGFESIKSKKIIF